MNSVFSWKRTFESVFIARSSPPGLCTVNKLAGNLHGLVDPLLGTSWHKWNRYKLHRGIELVPSHKEWPPSWVYDLCHGTRRGLF